MFASWKGNLLHPEKSHKRAMWIPLQVSHKVRTRVSGNDSYLCISSVFRNRLFAMRTYEWTRHASPKKHTKQGEKNFAARKSLKFRFIILHVIERWRVRQIHDKKGAVSIFDFSSVISEFSFIWIDRSFFHRQLGLVLTATKGKMGIPWLSRVRLKSEAPRKSENSAINLGQKERMRRQSMYVSNNISGGKSIEARNDGGFSSSLITA